MNYQKTKEVQEEASILELSSDNKVLIACDSAAKSVTIPQSVEEIDTAAFFACRRLKQIIIPDSVKIIRRNAFSLSRVRLIMIGKNVEMIERAAFADMTALEQIHVHLDNPYFNSQNGILYDKKMTTLLAYPAKCRIKEYTLPESVEVIGVQAIDENHTVTALHLNTNVREIAPIIFQVVFV